MGRLPAPRPLATISHSALAFCTFVCAIDNSAVASVHGVEVYSRAPYRADLMRATGSQSACPRPARAPAHLASGLPAARHAHLTYLRMKVLILSSLPRSADGEEVSAIIGRSLIAKNPPHHWPRYHWPRRRFLQPAQEARSATGPAAASAPSPPHGRRAARGLICEKRMTQIATKLLPLIQSHLTKTPDRQSVARRARHIFWHIRTPWRAWRSRRAARPGGFRRSGTDRGCAFSIGAMGGDRGWGNRGRY